ncbi:hypothetical protein H4219_002803 [Mycoemilia scoparia]|uniref:FIST domain-containing protein n=1 Tax=Mycoemilia scoparia TaxID=417184 RepID=A0A9W8A296_9FUNG|nr:hypothetical protein H4219_002803 [Mycoemilia scoparia]
MYFGLRYGNSMIPAARFCIATNISVGSRALFNKRHLWLSATSTNTDLTSAINGVAKDIQSIIPKSLEGAPVSMSYGDVCFAIVTQNYHGSEIDLLPQTLQKALGVPSVHVLGTVVDKIIAANNSTRFLSTGLSILYHRNEGNTKVTPFYFGEENRARLKTNSVGRWHRSYDKKLDNSSFSIHPKIDLFESVSRPVFGGLVPDNLLKLEKDDVDLILMASDNESSQVLESLDKHFPSSTKIGIQGVQTPFLNGREFTIFGGKDVINSSGVSGVAFSKLKDSFSDLSLLYPTLVPISESVKISRCRGNVILELDNSDAVKELIQFLKKHRTGSKSTVASDKNDISTRGEGGGIRDWENELYIKVICNPTDEGLSNDTAIYQITGGDPGHGGLLVNSTKEFQVGQRVQFYIRQPYKETKYDFDFESTKPSGPIVSFLCTPPEEVGSAASSDLLQTGSDNIGKVFGGSSEKGFIYGRPIVRSQKDSNNTSGSRFESVAGQGSTECSVSQSCVQICLSN